MTTIYLIRHAQAEGNLYRRCQGWHNGLITDAGRTQIQALERRFEGVHIDAVYSSDLIRTMTTSGALTRSRSLPLRLEPGLREVSCGVWEDKTWGQWLHEDRENLLAFLRRDPTWHAPGSETHVQVRDRMRGTILRLVAKHSGQTLALFSHGSAIRVTLAGWPGVPENISLGSNTCVSKILVEGGTVQVKYYNDASHLGIKPPSPGEDTAAAEDIVREMERSGVYFEPLPIQSNKEFYLKVRQDGWMASHGTMEGFDGESFLQTALRNSDHALESVLAAKNGSRVAGVLQMDLEQEADELAGRVPFLYVAEGFRRSRVGTQLLGQAISTFRSQGRRYLRLRCAPENNSAQSFYRAHGFRKVGEESGGTGKLDTLEKYIGLML